MNLLAIDTSTEACSAALATDDSIIERFELAPRRHAELVLPMVEEVLAEAGATLSDLDGVAFGRGPGAFTGVRIAAGVIQGIAYGTGLRVARVSSLAAMAQQTLRELGHYQVIALLDARIGEVYCGIFRAGTDDLMQPVGEEQVCGPGEVPLPPKRGWFGVGTGWAAYPQALQDRLGERLAGMHAECYPHAADVARLARASFASGDTVEAAQALPVYLRDRVTA